MSLPREERLRERGKFSLLFKKGKSVSDRFQVLYFYPWEGKVRKAGFSAGKKLGKAVLRNRIRRKMKEAYRSIYPCVEKGYLLLFIGRKGILDADYQEIEKSQKKLLRRAGIWKGEEKNERSF